MADTNIGERIASLEAAFKGFRNEMLRDNAYIKEKLDVIVDSLSQKVDRPYCQDRHEKVDDGLRTLERKTPAFIQTVIVALSTGSVMAAVSYIVAHLP